MNFIIGLFRTIILLGAVQGFIVSCLLFFSKRSTQSTRILSKLIFLMALASFKLYASMQGWFDYNDWTRVLDAVLPMIIVMPFGPLIFFYVKSSVDPNFKFSRKDRIHFYPIIIDFIPQIIAIIYIIALITGLIKNNYKPFGLTVGSIIDDYNVYVDIPRWIAVSSYLLWSAKFLNNLKERSDGAATLSQIKFKWLHQFIRVFLVFQIIWLAYLVPYIIPRYTDFMLSTFDWYPLYIPMAGLIYWMGIKGYMMADNSANNPIRKLNAAVLSLSSGIIDDAVILLTKAMEADKLYLDPSLNLQLLSRHINIPQKTISAVLNQHVHKSFNEFVNDYRIEAFKEKLNDPAMNHLTIAGIAFECGFNSQATFQRAFKQSTGLSPSEFRNASVEIE
ncbi:MAG: AraC family transcriptional regulator [Bacteroidetes bacterium]|nr:AraC family transcriptional regulator [Bacteroidota bacterium]